MAYNKAEAFGKVLIDLTSDTVTPGMLKEGVTAHNAAGEKITGTMVVQELDILSTKEEFRTNMLAVLSFMGYCIMCVDNMR